MTRRAAVAVLAGAALVGGGAAVPGLIQGRAAAGAPPSAAASAAAAPTSAATAAAAPAVVRLERRAPVVDRQRAAAARARRAAAAAAAKAAAAAEAAALARPLGRSRCGAVEHAYGPDPLQHYDVIPATTGRAPHPVVVFFHGGSWGGGDKCGPEPTPPAYLQRLADRGMTVVNANYRRPKGVAPGGRTWTLGDTAADVVAVVTTVQARARMHGIDPARVATMGGSAGAHLALVAAAAVPQVRAVIAFSPFPAVRRWIETPPRNPWSTPAHDGQPTRMARMRRAAEPPRSVAAAQWWRAVDPDDPGQLRGLAASRAEAVVVTNARDAWNDPRVQARYAADARAAGVRLTMLQVADQPSAGANGPHGSAFYDLPGYFRRYGGGVDGAYAVRAYAEAVLDSQLGLSRTRPRFRAPAASADRRDGGRTAAYTARFCGRNAPSLGEGPYLSTVTVEARTAAGWSPVALTPAVPVAEDGRTCAQATADVRVGAATPLRAWVVAGDGRPAYAPER